MAGSRRGKSPSKGDPERVGLKSSRVLMKGHTRPETSGPGTYRSVLTVDKLAKIRIQYGVPGKFDLELPNSNVWVNNLPPRRLGVSMEAFEARLRFPIPPSSLSC